MEKKFLSRPEAAEHLTGLGMTVSKNTLQKMACLGGGPIYMIFGNRALYRKRDLENWAENRLGAPRHSTSEDLIA